MPNKKISELTTVASPLSADYIPLVEDGVTKKATLASLPLSDAEVTALALKAPLASPTFTGTATIPTLALTNDLAVTEGGTGASTAADARTSLGAAASGANTDITSLSAPALGAATATTAASNDSSTKVATTAFVNPANSIAGDGYHKLPSGLIIQWGVGFFLSSTGETGSFPLAFPTACLGAFICHAGNSPAAVGAVSITTTTTQFTGYSTGVGPYTAQYLAIGY
jgi:hypothetical protein